MYVWLVGRMMRRGYAQAVAGRPTMLMRLAHDDIEFVFPGQSSFAGSLRGKDALAGWMARFASMHPDFEVRDVIASGPPWSMRVAVRFRDAIGDDYRNEGVEYLSLVWGRLRRLEVFLDTERLGAWESRHPELVSS